MVLKVSISINDYFKNSILSWKKENEELSRCTTPFHCDLTRCLKGNCKAYGEIDTLSYNQIMVLNFTKIEYTDGGMGANPGGGGRGDVSPHVFSGGGHNIKCSPPPHVLGVG